MYKMEARKVYFNDLVHAMVNEDIADQFEAWCDLYYPDAPSYFVVLSEMAFQRGMDNMYRDIISGKFKEEMDNAPVREV